VHEGGVGVVLTTERGPGVAELRAVAVAPEHQRRGHGLAMVRAVLEELRRGGWDKAVVATGTADPAGLLLYQRAGFRPLSVERDVFTPERGYDDPAALVEPNGLVHRDVVWLDVEL
jgi:ribosomal protein S18 acetylase RimI-like enzyme